MCPALSDMARLAQVKLSAWEILLTPFKYVGNNIPNKKVIHDEMGFQLHILIVKAGV